MSDSTMIKVFNLTDVSTPNLVQRGLVEQHVAIGDRMCEPGQYIEQPDSPLLREQLRHLVSVGALSIDMLPPPYQQARALLGSAAGKASVRHTDIKETKVVELQEAAPATADAPTPMADAAPATKDEEKASKRSK